jgi:hypothetical protein
MGFDNSRNSRLFGLVPSLRAGFALPRISSGLSPSLRAGFAHARECTSSRPVACLKKRGPRCLSKQACPFTGVSLFYFALRNAFACAFRSPIRSFVHSAQLFSYFTSSKSTSVTSLSLPEVPWLEDESLP